MLRIRRKKADPNEGWRDVHPNVAATDLVEDTEYLIELSLDAGTGAGARAYVDDVELERDPLGCFLWKPGFYAGRVTIELELLVEQPSTTYYLLDVSPNPSKSGQVEFDEMVDEIRAYDHLLLGGSMAATLAFGPLGVASRLQLHIQLARLKAHGHNYLAALETVARAPHQTLVPDSRILPLSQVRRLDPSSLHQRGIASLVAGRKPLPESIDSVLVRNQTSTPTFDTPANRALYSLLRRFLATVSSLQADFENVKQGDSQENLSELRQRQRRLQFLRGLEARGRKLLTSPHFSSITRHETTSAGLTQIAALPVYSLAYRIGGRALATGMEVHSETDYLPCSPTWGIYEAWCYVKVVETLKHVTSEKCVVTKPHFVGADKCVSFNLGNTIVEVLYQATFRSRPAYANGRGYSISRERRPDIVLVVRNALGTHTYVLDAKWRGGRENVLEAMESAHIYHDSLRLEGKPPVCCLLLLPGESKVPEIEAQAYVDANQVGAISNVCIDGAGTDTLANYLRKWLLTP